MKRIFFVTTFVATSVIFSMNNNERKSPVTRRPSDPLKRVRGESFGTKDFLEQKEMFAKDNLGTNRFRRGNFAAEENITPKTLQRSDSLEKK